MVKAHGVEGNGTTADQYGAYGESGWVRFLVVCFLYKTNPNPRKTICCGKKSAPNATINLFFLGLGLALGWGVRRFHVNSYMFSHPTEFGISQTPQWLIAVGLEPGFELGSVLFEYSAVSNKWKQ